MNTYEVQLKRYHDPIWETLSSIQFFICLGENMSLHSKKKVSLHSKRNWEQCTLFISRLFLHFKHAFSAWLMISLDVLCTGVFQFYFIAIGNIYRKLGMKVWNSSIVCQVENFKKESILMIFRYRFSSLAKLVVCFISTPSVS